MKRLPLLTACLLAAAFAAGQSRNLPDRSDEEAPLPEGPELMRQVRAQLPPMPLRLTGKVRTRQNRQQQDRRLVSELRFGDRVPQAAYTLSDAFGDPLTRVRVSWPEGRPVFEQWDSEGKALPAPSPQDEVADTGLTWSDLALDFLWWPGAKALERDLVKTRSAVKLSLPAPPGRKDLDRLTLWVDERALFIVRAEFFDAKGELLRRIEVDSIKKVRDDFWMVKDLKIFDRAAGRRMGIRFEEVEELTPDLQPPTSDLPPE